MVITCSTCGHSGEDGWAYNHDCYWVLRERSHSVRANSVSKVLPMNKREAEPVIHEISAWTGTGIDETPLCGANKFDPFVWGFRTVYTALVTCPECQDMRQRWTAALVTSQGER